MQSRVDFSSFINAHYFGEKIFRALTSRTEYCEPKFSLWFSVASWGKPADRILA